MYLFVLCACACMSAWVHICHGKCVEFRGVQSLQELVPALPPVGLRDRIQVAGLFSRCVYGPSHHANLMLCVLKCFLELQCFPLSDLFWAA